MKTFKQRNMVNREMKLAIVDKLQTLFHPIVNTTKQAAEETRKDLAPMKKALTDIDCALAAQRVEAPSKTSLNKNADITFGLHRKQNGQLGMGTKVVRIDINGKTLTVESTEYKLTPGLIALITQKHPRPGQWNSDDYQVYKPLVAQTNVKSFPNRAGTAQLHATWKWNHMITKIVIPGERIAEEESEDTDDTDSVESYPSPPSIGDIDRTAPGILTSDSDILSPDTAPPAPSIQPSPLHTRPYRKAKRSKKDRETFYKGYGVVYLPRDINGLAKKLH